MNVLDLFSGIGGFSLGLERAGMRTIAFCEIDPFCRRVLAKHWPNVPVYNDVRTLTAARLMADAKYGQPQECSRADGKHEQWAQKRRGPEQSTGIGTGSRISNGDFTARNNERGSAAASDPCIDVICGGFPCQDISVAGKGAGIDGSRSGLWSEYARIIGEVRPRYVIVENVTALLGRGLSRVLGDLAALGFDAEWDCIPASSIGAPHRRDRVWITAYSDGGQLRDKPRRRDGTCGAGEAEPGDDGAQGVVPNSDSRRREGFRVSQHGGEQSPSRHKPDGLCEAGWRDGALAKSCGPRLEIGQRTLREWAHAATTGTGWWATEPDVGRVVDGPTDKVDRRKRLIALGNAVVPAIPEIIGRAIMEAERAPHAR